MRIPQHHEKISFKWDKGLILCLCLFMGLSLISIWCAAPLMSQVKDAEVYWIRQAGWYGIGFIAIFFCLKLGTERFYVGTKIIYWILLFLLGLLLVDRYLIDLPYIKPVHGTTAWIQIPKLGSFQPGEFMKIVLIILVGEIIDKHNKEKQDDSFSSDFHLFIKILKVIFVPLVLILLEPETGIPIILMFSILLMCFLSGIRKEWILIGGSIFIFLVILIFYLYYYQIEFLESLVGSGYKLNRLKGWLETERYASSHGYQLFQGLLAIGSSGWTGYPLRSVLIYFSEPQTDFIFAVICQNFGFLGAGVTVFLCTFLDLKLYSIAVKSPNGKEKYTLFGMIGMLLFQQIENMGMVLGLFPITGITLPFISYGGSSMLSYMIWMAVVFQMSHENEIRTLH